MGVFRSSCLRPTTRYDTDALKNLLFWMHVTARARRVYGWNQAWINCNTILNSGEYFDRLMSLGSSLDFTRFR